MVGEKRKREERENTFYCQSLSIKFKGIIITVS